MATPAGTGGPHSTRPVPPATVLGALMVGAFLAVLDVLIVVTALPTIAGNLRGRADESWVITAYLLSSAAVTPLFGKLSDLIGRTRLYRVSIVVFVAGSALCAGSHNIEELILARALQGVGGGGLLVLPLAIAADVVEPRQRAKYQSAFVVNFALASGLGPVVGGVFVDQLSWRWIFLVNLPIGVAALAASRSIRLPEATRDRISVDYAGALLTVGATVCALLGLTWSDGPRGFASGPVVALLAGAAVLGIVLVVWERRASEAIFPPILFGTTRFNAVVGSTLLYSAAVQGAWVLVPSFLQLVDGVSGTVAGLLLLPFVASNTVAAVATGGAVSRTGRYKWAPVWGQLVTFGAFAWYVSFGSATSLVVIVAAMVVAGAGIGMSQQVAVALVQNSVEPAHLGAATSVVTFARSLGYSLGASIALDVYNVRLAHGGTGRLPTGTAASAVTAAVQGSPAALRSLPLADRGVLVRSFASALHGGFVFAVVAVVAAFMATLFIRDLPEPT